LRLALVFVSPKWFRTAARVTATSIMKIY
jgi:hypothetical protein